MARRVFVELDGDASPALETHYFGAAACAGSVENVSILAAAHLGARLDAPDASPAALPTRLPSRHVHSRSMFITPAAQDSASTSGGLFIRSVSSEASKRASEPRIAEIPVPRTLETPIGVVQIESSDMLGAGRHARVFAGTLSRDGTLEPVAVKVPRAGREAAAHIASECSSLHALASPHILPVIAAVDGCVVYARMDTTLAESMPSLSLDRAVAVAKCLFAALGDMHLAAFAHLDVKPHNILLKHDDVFLGDLGCAQRIGEPLFSPGTTAYVAPETLVLREPQSVHPAIDVYAAGVIMYVLLTGRQPFESPARDAPLFSVSGPRHVRSISAPVHALPAVPHTPLDGVALLLAVRSGFFAGGHNPWIVRPEFRGDARVEPLIALAESCLVREPLARPTAASVLSSLCSLE